MAEHVPIRSVDDFDVRRVEDGGVARVLLIDKRTQTLVADLTRAEAKAFAGQLRNTAVGEGPVRLDAGGWLSGSCQ